MRSVRFIVVGALAGAGCVWISDAEMAALRAAYHEDTEPTYAVDSDDTATTTHADTCDPVYVDDDRDGFGAGEAVVLPGPDCLPSGYANIDGDCDDTTDTIHPEATEECGNLVDDDCDGMSVAYDLEGEGRVDRFAGALIEDDVYNGGFGGAVHAGTDLDGDGTRDLVVGTYTGSAAPGGVWVFAGGPGLGGETPKLASHDAMATRSGADAWLAGRAVGGIEAGVRGDYGALLVGAPRYSHGVADQGAVFLLDGPLTGSASLDTAETVVSAMGGGMLVGSSVVASGDIDGDGRVDLLISSAESNLSGRASGAAWIVPAGAHTHESTVDVQSDAVAITAPTAAPEDTYLGKSAVLCDIDGDGSTEVVVGAPQPYAEPGIVGILDDIPTTDVAIDEADHVWTSGLGSKLGESVACGDFSGDGVDDIVTVLDDGDGWRVPFAFRPTGHTDFAAGSYLYADGVVSDYVSLATVPAIDGSSTDSLLVCFETAAAPEGQGLGFLVDGVFPGGATNLIEEARATVYGHASSRAFCARSVGSPDITGDDRADLIIGTWMDSGDGFGRVWVLPGG